MIAKRVKSFTRSMSSWITNRTVLMAVLVVPTQRASPWEQEKYSHIPKNEVSFSEKGILIRVIHSASPLIFPLDSTKKVTGFRVRGEFRGLPNFSNVGLQGEKGADDYVLRVGFVIPGNKHLTGLKKLFAPAWVTNLYSKVPNGSGLDRIQFFNVTQNPLQLGRHRVHPLSDLIQENFFAVASKVGAFDYDYVFKQPLDTSAVWISVDGDDSKSVFDVAISSIELSL